LRKFDATHQKLYNFSQETKVGGFLRKFHAFGGTKKVERLGNRYTLAILAMTLASCSGGNFGFQGGVIPEKFKGIDTIKAISPTSIQITWEGYPGSTQYRLYSSEENNPIAQPQFTSIVLQPNNTTRYSVTAVDPSNGSELGSRTNYVGPVSLLPHFSFKATGHIVPVEPSGNDGTHLRISWTGYENVTYRVYLGERSPDGSVNYNGFVSSSATALSQSSAVIGNLLPGHEYCAVMVASYQDNTNDGPDGTPYTTDTSTTLNGWAIGASGTFGDSKIASSQICARTSSSLSVDNVKVYSQKAYLSNRPVFYVYSDKSEDESQATALIETSIYQVSNKTGLASFIGKVKGKGQIISLTNLAPGRYKFFASIKGISGSATGAMAKKELIVNGSTEPDEAHRAWVYIRGTPDLEDTNNPASMGYYPEKQQDGYGAQGMGSSVAMGDFDCDGKYDIAIGIPNATETSTRDGRSQQSGKVIVYYDTDDNIGPTASPGPRSQIITFDVTPYISASRDLRLGTSLYVGNFNHDNEQTNQPPSSGQAHFECQDLVIGSGYGPMFVLYGKRNVTGQDGGLVYSGPTGYSFNPSSSCAPSSNVCSPALFTLSTGGLTNTVGVSIGSGDFNGDSYEDLVASTTINNNPAGVLVFRGSEYGLIPPAKWTGTGGGDNGINTTTGDCLVENFTPYPFPDGPKKGFPYIPADPTCWGDSSVYDPTTQANGWGDPGFGSSVGAFPNAYYDLDATTSKGSERVRDVLLIGNPKYSGTSVFGSSVQTSGRVYVCLPQTNINATVPSTLPTSPAYNFANTVSNYDMNQFFRWNCGYSSNTSLQWTPTLGGITASLYIDSPLNGSDINTASGSDPVLGKNFGSAIRGIRNPLLYKSDHLSLDGNLTDQFFSDLSSIAAYNVSSSSWGAAENTGTPGAIAIGASGNSKVFVYYGVHYPANFTPSGSGETLRNNLGKAKNNQLASILAGKRLSTGNDFYKAVAETPCIVDDGNGGKVTSYSSSSTYKESCNIQVLSPPGGSSWTNSQFGDSLFALTGSNDSGGIPDGKQSILAIPAPYRTISSSGSISYANIGSVQLYYQDIVSDTNAFPLVTGSNGCNDGFCRLSDGFTNNGSSTLEYDGDRKANLHFGSGGVAAGPVKSFGATYNPNVDIAVGVPGYVFQHGTTSVIDSGAVQLSFSSGGQLRSYQVGGSLVPSPWHVINNSFGQESDTRFYQAISMGDIDQDGLDDIAVRIKVGSENKLRILKGKATTDGSIAFKNTALDWINFSVLGDDTAGRRIIPVGKVSSSQFPIYFVTGEKASYLYFDGIGGLIPGQPSAFSSGGAPRKLFAPGGNYLDFSDDAIYGRADNADTDDYGSAFAHGDFNGDGFEDLAIGFNSGLSSLTDVITDPANPVPVSYTGMTGDNVGRVMIFYGGKDNGFQVQAESTGSNPGGFPYTNQYFAPYSGMNGVANSACDSTTGTCDKIQMLYEGTTGNNAVTRFGQSILAVPAGSCNGKAVSALLVQAVTQGSGSKVFIYKPKCVLSGASGDLSGLVTDSTANDDHGGTYYTYNTEINPSSTGSFPSGTTYTSNSFGSKMALIHGILGPVNGNHDARTHVVLVDSDQKIIFSFPLTSPSGTCNSYDANGNASITTGDCQINLTNETTEVTMANSEGYEKINYANSNALNGTVGFGGGVADIGDANGDTYEDVAISMTSLTKPGTPSTSSGHQGGLLILFGGPSGLQTLSSDGSTIIEPAQNSSCYRMKDGGSINSICNPTLLFASEPSADRDGSAEGIYLSRDSYLNFGTQNENLGSFLFGVPLRDTRETDSSDRILRGGAFYVLP